MPKRRKPKKSEYSAGISPPAQVPERVPAIAIEIPADPQIVTLTLDDLTALINRTVDLKLEQMSWRVRA